MKKEERIQGLSFAAQLKAMAETAPDGYARRDINRLVRQMHRRYGLNDEQKKALILRTIESGAATVKEIEDETGIPRQKVETLLNRLESENKIRRHRGNVSGTGRPALQFFAAYV